MKTLSNQGANFFIIGDQDGKIKQVETETFNVVKEINIFKKSIKKVSYLFIIISYRFR